MTNDGIIVTTYVGNNARLLERVCKLYLKDGMRVADVTYGKGVFWRKIDLSRFDLQGSDLYTCPETPYDFTNLPYESGSFDVVVLDPPYMHNFGKLSDSTYHAEIHDKYGNNFVSSNSHTDIIDLYRRGMTEAKRILRRGGMLWVKCMDEISGGIQRRSHIELWQVAVDLGLRDEDLFIMVNPSKPLVRHKQQHARKNCSFLWVFTKKGDG